MNSHQTLILTFTTLSGVLLTAQTCPTLNLQSTTRIVAPDRQIVIMYHEGVKAYGTQTTEQNFNLGAGQNVIPAPVNFCSDQVFLILYGTGIKHATKVTATVGPQNVPVAYSKSAERVCQRGPGQYRPFAAIACRKR